MIDDLIYDVGMHHGKDTEFYLAKGFRVLAIEANPKLTAKVNSRLSDAVGSDRLRILDVAIDEQPGERDFYLNKKDDGWSCLEADDSFAWAEWDKIQVPCVTFQSVLEEHGVPYYLKIDIEGADTYCVRALRECAAKPRFVSFEASMTDFERTFEAIADLWQLGYRNFKLVNQALNTDISCPNPAREGDYVDYRFDQSMSGPFGEESPGDWQDLQATITRYANLVKQQSVRTTFEKKGKIYGVPAHRFYDLLRSIYNAPPVKLSRRAFSTLTGRELGGWFDIHARLAD